MERPAAGCAQQHTRTSALGDALHSIADLELDYAVAQIAAFPAHPEDSVHQCRKTIKRLRALLRMGVAVPGVHRRPTDRRLRDAARSLAPMRDASVTAHTIARLIKQQPWLASLEGVSEIEAKRIDVDVSTQQTLACLEAARTGLSQIFGAGDAWTFASVTAGIESTYARAAKRMLRFSNKHDDTIAHEWRKEVQRLANQLGTIKDLCPESLPVTLSALSELADLLGTHNDLSVLRTRIGRLPKRTRRIFSDVSKAEQRILRAHALTLGGEIFARSPEAFRRSLLGETPDSVA